MSHSLQWPIDDSESSDYTAMVVILEQSFLKSPNANPKGSTTPGKSTSLFLVPSHLHLLLLIIFV